MAHSNGMASRNLPLCFLLSTLLYTTIGQTATRLEQQPEFLAPLENHTVIQGRDVFFTCVVNHLQSYRVAWIKSDSRAILAMHTHMVAPNPRLYVTHNGHNTWKLHVADVQPDDSGTYMCQVNTDPMRSQIGHMKVVIPPDIMDLDDTIDRLTSLEHGEVRLRCRATGNPKPEVTWRREDGRSIVLRHDDAATLYTKSHKSEHLHLIGILREEMGSYLCIASNGVPPTVSKRYYVNVLFEPTVKISHQIVAAQLNNDVTLECCVESSPKSLTTWYTESGVKVALDERYRLTESMINDYTYQVNLTIRRLRPSDFNTFTCFTENAFGKASADIQLQEYHRVKTTASTFHYAGHRKHVSKTANKNGEARSSLNDFQNVDKFSLHGKEMKSLARSEENEDKYSHLPAASGAHYGSTDFPGLFSLSGTKMVNGIASVVATILVVFVRATT